MERRRGATHRKQIRLKHSSINRSRTGTVKLDDMLGPVLPTPMESTTGGSQPRSGGRDQKLEEGKRRGVTYPFPSTKARKCNGVLASSSRRIACPADEAVVCALASRGDVERSAVRSAGETSAGRGSKSQVSIGLGPISQGVVWIRWTDSCSRRRRLSAGRPRGSRSQRWREHAAYPYPSEIERKI